jgi:hypothetical protein
LEWTKAASDDQFLTDSLNPSQQQKRQINNIGMKAITSDDTKVLISCLFISSSRLLSSIFSSFLLLSFFHPNDFFFHFIPLVRFGETYCPHIQG